MKLLRVFIPLAATMLASWAAPGLLRPALAGDPSAPSGYAEQLRGWAPAQLGLAISPDGATAYVPFELDDALLVVDLHTLTTVAAIDVSPAGAMLTSSATALTPDGRTLYVVNSSQGNVSVVDTQARRVANVLEGLDPLHGAAISMSPDGSSLYVPTWRGALNIVHTADGSVERIAVDGVSFVLVAVDPGDPNLLYAVGYLSAEVSPPQPAFFSFDVAARSVLRSVVLQPEALPPDSWPRRLEVDPSGSLAWFGYQSSFSDRGAGRLSRIDLERFVVTSSAPVGNGVSDFTVDPEGGKAYILGFWSGGGAPSALPVHEWDLEANALVRDIPVSPSSDQRAVLLDSVDGAYLYMTEGDHNLLRKVDLATGQEVGRVQFHRDRFRPYSILSDGRLGYVMCQGSSRIFTLDLVTGSILRSVLAPLDYSGWGIYDGLIYVAMADRFAAVDPATGAVVAQYLVAGRQNLQRLTFYGDRMAAIDHGGETDGHRLVLFDAHTFTRLIETPLPPEPHGDKVIASPDGLKLYVAQGLMMGGTATITIYDARTLQVLNAIEVPPLVQRHGATSFVQGDFDISARLLYLTGFSSVYRIDMDTDSLVGSPLHLIDLYEGAGISGWSPTGLSGLVLSASRERLHVVSGDAHTMYTYDLAQAAWRTEMTDVGGYFVTDAVASPDRTHLYTVNSRMDSVSMIDLSTGEVVRILDLGDAVSDAFLPLLRRG